MNLLITGVGGQGIVMASDIVSEVALATGYDVKKTDTIGMAQRGGSVISNVRIAPKVFSPLIPDGEVDILLAFEKLEATRWIHHLHPNGIAIVNNHTLPPLSVSAGMACYPSDEKIIDSLKQRTARIYFIDGTRKANELGNIRTLNTFMLGCASIFLPFKMLVWKDCISWKLPAKIHKINLTVFSQGRKEMKKVSKLTRLENRAEYRQDER
ncbi:indolepyruvate oxidoreductase subunit beta [Chloroflexota bacterium]